MLFLQCEYYEEDALCISSTEIRPVLFKRAQIKHAEVVFWNTAKRFLIRAFPASPELSLKLNTDCILMECVNRQKRGRYNFKSKALLAGKKIKHNKTLNITNPWRCVLKLSDHYYMFYNPLFMALLLITNSDFQILVCIFNWLAPF